MFWTLWFVVLGLMLNAQGKRDYDWKLRVKASMLTWNFPNKKLDSIICFYGLECSSTRKSQAYCFDGKLSYLIKPNRKSSISRYGGICCSTNGVSNAQNFIKKRPYQCNVILNSKSLFLRMRIAKSYHVSALNQLKRESKSGLALSVILIKVGEPHFGSSVQYRLCLLWLSFRSKWRTCTDFIYGHCADYFAVDLQRAIKLVAIYVE